jgi:hypothetical protein
MQLFQDVYICSYLSENPNETHKLFHFFFFQFNVSQSNKQSRKRVFPYMYCQRLFSVWHLADSLAVCTKMSCSCKGIRWIKRINEETELWRRVCGISLKSIPASWDRALPTRSCQCKRTGVSLLKQSGY